ncbi:MAG TPA: YbdK family carboxylate-amine ligase [Solirubrobacterales bacterium]|nr:YbdK family carboxylate-amine ligase [Solirubrobacterales bacterium]
MSATRGFDMTDLSAERLEAIFDSPAPLTVGLEEEVMLLDPTSLDLAPRAEEVLARVAGDRRFKAELPASQVEILTDPTDSVEAAIRALAGGRRDLAEAALGLARPATVGVHPFAAAEGKLSSSERYGLVRAEYGRIARCQLVASLQVHVAVGAAEQTLPVYNALRSYLPEIAALAANAAFYRGGDTELASVRPKIAELLPRQGMPPAIENWERFAEELRWGAAAGVVIEPRHWWWELRPHPGFGTLEVRVPDAQTTLADAAGIVAVVQALVASLSERHRNGDRLDPAQTWRIDQNRWSAARSGVDGQMADLETGELEPTRDRLRRLLDELEPVGRRLGSSPFLARASRLASSNGAIRQREVARREGVKGLAAWLADHFLDHEELPESVLRLDDEG